MKVKYYPRIVATDRVRNIENRKIRHTPVEAVIKAGMGFQPC